MRKLTKRHKQIQEEIAYKSWEEYKGEITMWELAFVLRNMPKSERTFYRIINKRSQDNK